MSVRSLSLCVLCLLSANPLFATDKPADIERVLERLVNQQRESTKLVGLGAAIMLNGELIGPTVSGERKKGSQVELEKQDSWHLGSVTKSITATMMARLIEQGELNWDTSIKDSFSDADGLNPQWHDVTLKQLLNHSSGAPPNFPLLVGFKYPELGQERTIARESAVLDLLSKPPESQPGTTFTYSNVGYTIAGVIAERQTGLTWEELIIREIFTPLKLKSGGFGPPKDNSKALEQPRGHKKLFGFTRAAGTQDDNTPIIGPAGSIHMSLSDLVIYANVHLQYGKGLEAFLEPDAFRQLHEPELDNYALGWVISSPKKIGAGKMLWHNGSNTMWYTMLAILPELNAVIAIAANDGNIQVAEKSALKIIKKLARSISEVDHSRTH